MTDQYRIRLWSSLVTLLLLSGCLETSESTSEDTDAPVQTRPGTIEDTGDTGDTDDTDDTDVSTDGLGNGTDDTAPLDDTDKGPPAASVTPKLATGLSHTLALRSDGRVFAWGLNDDGQLGDGTRENRLVPTPVETPSGFPAISDIAAQSGTSYAVGVDGTLWVWGSTFWLQDTPLGDGRALIPTQVAGVSGVTAIDAGKTHMLALHDTGGVLAWGSGTYGKLGVGGTENWREPVWLESIPASVVDVSAGGEHSVAVLENGTVLGWGSNGAQRLGLDSDIEIVTVPTPIAGFSNIARAIAPNSTFTMALTRTGILMAVGQNQSGNPFGLGTWEEPNAGVGTHSDPVQTGFGDNIRSFAVYDSSVLVLKTDGHVHVAGFYSTSIGVLPALIPAEHDNISTIIHTTSRRLPIPTRVESIDSIESIAVPWGQGPTHVAFLTESGMVYAGGNNSRGQLGDGTTSMTYVRDPISVGIVLR